MPAILQVAPLAPCECSPVPTRPRTSPVTCTNGPTRALRGHLASPPIPPCPARPGVGRREGGGKSPLPQDLSLLHTSLSDSRSRSPRSSAGSSLAIVLAPASPPLTQLERVFDNGVMDAARPRRTDRWQRGLDYYARMAENDSRPSVRDVAQAVGASNQTVSDDLAELARLGLLADRAYQKTGSSGEGGRRAPMSSQSLGSRRLAASSWHRVRSRPAHQEISPR
jgi:hypothetical protein